MIVNNPNIFCMAAGLVAAKGLNYTYWNTFDGSIFDLIVKINEISIDDDIKAWFCNAENIQMQYNPYWPRGYAMHAATFFIDNGSFNIEDFLEFMHSLGIKDPKGDKDFRVWIAELPKILDYMENKFIKSSAWNLWCDIVKRNKTEWEYVVKQAQETVTDFYQQNFPCIVFTPNLLIPFQETNSVQIGNCITISSYIPIAENIIHEALRKEVSKHKDIIKPFYKEHKLDNFADYLKMHEYGYMQYYETQEEFINLYLKVIEECFARGISAVLAGGGAKRLTEHANLGFGSVPYIGYCFIKSKPKAAQLGNFISSTIDNFT